MAKRPAEEELSQERLIRQATFAESSIFNTNEGGHGSLFPNNTISHHAQQHYANGPTLTPPPSSLKSHQQPGRPEEVSSHLDNLHNATSIPTNEHGSLPPPSDRTPLHTPLPPVMQPDDLVHALQAHFEYIKELEKELAKRQ